MKKEAINELRKIFESNMNKEKEKEEKDKIKQKNEKNTYNRSVYINSSNLNQIKSDFNKNIKQSELESIRKSLVSVKRNDEKKSIETKKESTKELKEDFKNKINTFSNNNENNNLQTTKTLKLNSIQNKEINKNILDKVSMFNNFIDKNKNKNNESLTTDFYSRGKTSVIKDAIKNIAKSNLKKTGDESKEYEHSFDKLQSLQTLLKKESSFRELCKIYNLIFHIL